MADTMLPPLVLELRAKASELIGEVKLAATETEKAAAKTKASAAEIEAASAKAGESAAAGAEASSAGWQKFMGVSKAAAIGVVASGAVVGVESIKMASEFQSSMTLLQTAGGEQAKNMKTVSDGILTLARATGTSTEQLAEGMYTVEKGGFRGAAGLNVLKAAAEGAKSENVDLSVATNALTSVMMSYHLKASDAVSVQNMLVAGSGKAKTSMQEYASSLSTVIPIASAAGVGFDQVAGAIATLTQHGTSAQEATQELSNTIRNLQAPNAVAQKAMQQLGLSVNDVSAGLADPKVGLQGTIEKITGAIRNHLGPAGNVVVDAFNKSASATKDLQTMIGKMPPQLATLSKGLLDGNVSIGEYTKGAKSFGGQAGAMGLQFAGLYKNADGFNSLLRSGTTDQQTAAAALKNMMGGATGLNTALMLSGESSKYFTDATKEVSKAGKQAGGDISTWGKTQQTFSVQMSRLKEDVQTAAIVIGTKLLPPVQAFVGFLVAHPGALVAFAAVITGVLVVAAVAYFAKMVKGAAENVASFAKMIKAGVEWAATNAKAFAGAVIDYVKYTVAGETWLAEQLGRFRKSAIAAGEWIAEHVAGFAVMVAGWATTAAAATAAFIAENAATLGIGVAIAALVAAVIWLVTHWSQAWKWIKEAAEKVWNFLKPAFEWIGNAFHTVASFVQKHAKVIMGALLFILPPVALIIAAVHFLVTHWTQIWGTIKSVTSAVVNWLRGVWDWIANTFVGNLKAAIGFLSDAWSKAWNAIGNAVQWVVNNLILPVVGWVKSHVIDPLKLVVLEFQIKWQQVWAAVGSAMQWVHEHVIAPVGSAIHTALSAVGSAIGWLGGVWSSIWDGIKSAVDAVWRFLKPIFDAIGGAIKTVVGGISKVTGAIGGGLSKVGSLLGFANGGVIPGAPGAPRLVIAHGGEVVLSRDMLAGRQAPPPELAGSAIDANSYTPTNPTQAALAGGSTSTSSPTASSSSGGGRSTVVNISVQTAASPAQIAGAVGHELRKTA